MGANKANKLSLRQRISGAIMETKINIETGDLGKLADAMEKAAKDHIAENPQKAELNPAILNNQVYAAVVGICEGREANGSYTGNGHHLAQEITESVVKALIPPAPPEMLPVSDGSEFM